VTSVPVRTCVGCGARSPQVALIRFAVSGNALALDPRRRLGGRGAWLHRDAACWGEFVQRRGAVRSLRANPSRAAREALRQALVAGGC
jgi:predicted RNA-binding protein YlxR (DUF448 family)